MAAVAADKPLRLNCFGPRAGVDHGRDAEVGLREADQPGTELHHTTELVQAEPQRLLDAPLRRHQAGRIRDVRAVLQRLRLSATEGHPAVRTGRADWHCQLSVGEDAVDEAKVVEHLEGARLDAFAA